MLALVFEETPRMPTCGPPKLLDCEATDLPLTPVPVDHLPLQQLPDQGPGPNDRCIYDLIRLRLDSLRLDHLLSLLGESGLCNFHVCNPQLP